MLYSTYGGTSKASRCGPDCILLARKGVSEGWMLNHPTKYRWGERVGRVNNAIQPDDQKSETGPSALWASRRLSHPNGRCHVFLHIHYCHISSTVCIVCAINDLPPPPPLPAASDLLCLHVVCMLPHWHLQLKLLLDCEITSTEHVAKTTTFYGSVVSYYSLNCLLSWSLWVK